jgi:hypothetical protein
MNSAIDGECVTPQNSKICTRVVLRLPTCVAKGDAVQPRALFACERTATLNADAQSIPHLTPHWPTAPSELRLMKAIAAVRETFD